MDPEDLHEHERFSQNGLEQCPVCGRTFGGQGGHHGAVFEADGTRHDAYYETDYADGPFYCPWCYRETYRSAVNRSLFEFG